MAELSQTVSSQSRMTEGKPYSDVLNKSLSPKPKPPLLPKPQFAVASIRNGKCSPVKKIQTSSQTIISVKNVSSEIVHKQLHERGETILNNINIADSVVRSESFEGKNNGRISEKPPALYPKPKLPPKSNAFKSGRSNILSSPSSGENSPEKNSSNSGSTIPIRPPRSPKKLFKDNPLEEFQNCLLLSPDSPEPPFNFSEQRQKSASLPRSEFVHWTFREFQKNPNNHNGSVDSGKDITAPTPRPRLKNKPKFHIELDLAANLQDVPVYATVDYSKKKNRQSNPVVKQTNNPHWNESALRSSDSLIYYNCQAGGLPDLGDDECIVQNCNISIGGETNTDINEIENGIVESSSVDDDGANQQEKYFERNVYSNNYSSFNSDYNPVITCEKYEEKEKCSIMNAEDTLKGCIGGSNADRGSTENSPSAAVPQSFLHRFVSNSPKAKEDAEEENDGRGSEGNPNNSSFLHKFQNGKSNALLSPHENLNAFEVVKPKDVEAADERKSNEKRSSVDSTSSRNSEQVLPVIGSDTKDAENTRGTVGSEESSNLGKRFPWFGSFGKGNKKRSEKKERCSSQFYATPITLSNDSNMSDCSRTKSLPNIKSNDKAVDGGDGHSLRDWSSRNTESLNSEFSTLTHNSDAEDDKDSVKDVEVYDNGKKADKAFLIAKELTTSEEVFIDVLKLLNVDFRNFVESRNKDKNNVIPQSNLNKILNHLPELQTLNEVLLADLRKRMLNWETNPKISDVIVKKGAFLKLYTSYIQNFESQTKYLDECVAKYPKFGKVLKEFESLDRCKMLTLKHYMLKPVQRIPQYRLLLNDYLKHIDESSPDYDDTENALKIVSEVADHVNRNLKYGDRNGTLMHFQSLLSDYELIKPGRELIKDGPLEKICRKSVKDRYFILLNDCLLHTTYSKSSLKIHQELPLSGMKVCCNEDHKNRYCFTVYSTTRSFILCAKSEAERNEWVNSLQSAIEQYISRQKTFMNVKIPETDAFKIGKEAPVWIQDSKVTMCQICTAEFTSLFRRHHCRACGKVICKNCGGSQAPLQYDSFKAHRVCDQCFPILLKDYEDAEDEIYEILKMNNPEPTADIQNIYLNNKAKFIKYTSTSKPKFIPPRLKEVSANDAESEMNGLLYRKSRKAWKLYWYVLKEHVLYVYRASEDVKALETIPVLGYEVKLSDVNHENIDKSLIFILEHRHQSPIVFHAETEYSAERWYEALKRAAEFEELSGS